MDRNRIISRQIPRWIQKSTKRPFQSLCRHRVQLAAQDLDDSSPSTTPRWKQTPQAMKLPFQIRIPAKQEKFVINESPEKLHAVLDEIIGKGLYRLLSEDTRWLAVTHKSFDQGKRGFNDRLAILGRRLVEKLCSEGLVGEGAMLAERGRGEVGAFKDVKIQGVEALNAESKEKILHVHRVGVLADQYGLGKVVRWKPRSTADLLTSGYHMIMAQSLYAIVGAVALERGGAEASKIVKEKILAPLGLRL